MTKIKYYLTPVTYEQFNVIISYTCPICGERQTRKVDAGEVYWLQEASVDVNCVKCNNELRLRSMN